MPKNTKIEIRIDTDEKNKLQKIVSNKGETISSFLRKYIASIIKEEENNAKNN